MKGIRYSRLYPRAWQNEFGEEFDALNEMRTLRLLDVADILSRAIGMRLASVMVSLPLVGAWIAIAFLNLAAKEVQWAAGGLLALSGILAAMRPRRWFAQSVCLFLAIPISSLYFYQVPHIVHAPLYKTAVALIPALVGGLGGLGLRSVVSMVTPRRAA